MTLLTLFHNAAPDTGARITQRLRSLQGRHLHRSTPAGRPNRSNPSPGHSGDPTTGRPGSEPGHGTFGDPEH